MPDSSAESDMAFFLWIFPKNADLFLWILSDFGKLFLWKIYFSGIFNISYNFQTDLKNSEREQVRLHGTVFMGIFAES